MSGVHQKYISGEWVVIGIGDAEADTPSVRKEGLWLPLSDFLPENRVSNVPLTTCVPGGTPPAMTAFGPDGTVMAYLFDEDDFVYGTVIVPDDAAAGETATFSVDWSCDGTDTETVKWEFIQTVAAPEGVFANEETDNGTDDGPGTAWTLVSTGVMTVTLPAPGSVYQFRLRRVTNGGTDNADDVFALNVSLSYPRAGGS